MEFASPAWSPWLEGDKTILEKVQQKAVKMISGLKGGNYEEKCRELGLETLEKRRTKQDMAEVYRIVKGDRGSNIFIKASAGGAIRTRTAADPSNLRKGFARTDIRKNFFTLRVVDMWNGLPAEVKQAPNQKAFKRALNRVWKDQK